VTGPGSAVESLRTLVARGGYRPGDRLPAERELAALLQVSRPTVREAIGRLVETGSLITRRGAGTFVAHVELRHVFEVRLGLEPLAAAGAARNRSAADLERLERLLGVLASSVDDAPRFAATDAELHTVVATTAANPVLDDVLGRLAELAELSRSVTSPDRRVRQRTLAQWRRLVAAVESRDDVGAAAEMRRHLEQLSRAAS
jgi:GntR family transcriptional repressor for pyruvate dehydrogenase complex